MAITLTHDCDVERRDDPTALNGDFRDTGIREATPDVNADATQWNVGVYVPGGKGSEVEVAALLWFDLKAFIPADATITAAVWWLYIVNNTDVGDHEYQAVRIRRNDEGSGNHWKEDEATWNIYRTGNAWSNPGAANDTTDRDSALTVGPAAISGTGWKNINVLTLVSDAWSNRSGICTFIFERHDAYMTDAGHVQVHAKNYYDYGPALVHHLRITYTLDGRTFQAMVR